MDPTKTMVAMSGGVDSSVAAWLSLRQGHSCAGAIMRLWKPESAKPSHDIADAASVAERMGIPFHVLEMEIPFKKMVVEAFIRSYEAGLTPNPCIICNKQLKFDLFLAEAKKRGYDQIVTGHYARIRKDPETGRYLLYKAVDQAKDQSYFLYCLSQEQLSHTLLPLGELTKAEVRQIAQAQGFLNASKKDSQDICFVPDGDYFSFMQSYNKQPYPSGDFLDQDGNVVGRHKGAVGYTLGQRKGLGLAMGAPVYVCAKDMCANTVTVGPEEMLFHNTVIATDCNFFPFPVLTAPLRVTAKVRYRHHEQPATVFPTEDGAVKVVFDTPQRAMTPGQAIVFYQDDLVIGGGTITEVYAE